YWTPDGPGPAGAAPGSQCASGVLNGHLVFEAKVPFGAIPYQLSLSPGADTCGLWFYELDGGTWYGWWRSEMTDTQPAYPQFYGTLILRRLECCDIAVTEIIQPVGVVDTNTVVTPTATWENKSATAVGDFTAYFELYDPTDALYYREEIPVVGLEAGAETTLYFPDSSIGTQTGDWVASCSTFAGNDTFPANDVMSQGFTVSAGKPDVGVTGILAPTGFIDTIAPVTPKAKAKNFGDVTMTFDAWFIITDTTTDAEVYRQSATVTGLDPNVTRVFDFPDWTVTEPRVRGPYVTVCSLAVSDLNPANDTMSGSFFVGINWPFGWREVASMPAGAKPVKRGAWLAINGDGMMYATKGYKTCEFYRYDPIKDSWKTRKDVPANEEGRVKPPRKGCKGVSDGDRYIYMTKGNNTLGFWRYDIVGDTWERMTSVPEGSRRKKVKGGTDLAYVVKNDTAWVYLLKGYKTEFYKYDVANNAWITLQNVPFGTREKYDKGSFLVYDGDNTLYAHQAKYYNKAGAFLHHHMFKYDVVGDSWYSQELNGMPLYGLHSGRIKKKKSKDGGSGAWYESEIYALKGGNTQQFWKYIAAQDTWQELDTVPTNGSTGRKKRVKYGADIVGFGGGAFFALKGNKTLEAWRYMLNPELLAARPERSGVMAGLTRASRFGLTITPNPLASGFATLRYSLPNAGPVSLSVFDVAGRVVRKQTIMAARNGAANLDLRTLSAGVYLVRLDTDGFATTSKLIVQH
ncbi:hypothetical protein CH330_00270, partial [candidate division WOR-3 bacterium JGI_Cruoil_03_51_56]